MNDNKKKSKYMGYARFATKEQMLSHNEETAEQNVMNEFEKLVYESKAYRYVDPESIRRDREHFNATKEERRRIIERTSYFSVPSVPEEESLEIMRNNLGIN